MFRLSDGFITQFKGKQPQWGFGDLSYVVYKRSYARQKEDGSQEEFWETIQRVVEGIFNIQLKHCQQVGLPWNAIKAQASAQKMFTKMWLLKFIAPGRGLWLCGTPIIDKIGSAGLNNCGFISTKDINKDFSYPFCWAADMLMLGVGIGFDTKGAAKLTINEPIKDETTLIVPDSREGWIDAIRQLLESYAKPGRQTIRFDFSLVRGPGLPIKGFGGTSSGPEPLKVGLESIRSILNAVVSKPITSVIITDIMNFIGKLVVSGNVRRSAEIAIGEVDDIDFLQMKDWRLFPKELNDRRWASNNSVFVSPTTNFDEVVKRTVTNGEPGFIFLENARHFGRIKDGWNDATSSKYDNIDGFNPSLRAGTLVLTKEGIKPIDSLDGRSDIFVRNFRGEWQPAKAFKSGKDKQLYRIKFNSGYEVYCTPEHKWPLIKKNLNATRDNLENVDYSSFDKLRTDELVGGEFIYAPKIVRPLHDNKSEFFTNEDAFWFGWWHGDGWASYRKESDCYQIGAIVANNDGPEVRRRVHSYLEKISDKKLTGCVRSHGVEYNLRNDNLVEKTRMFNPTLNKYHLPEIIWSQNNDFISHFIDGLFSSDGCVTQSNNVWTIQLTSKSERLIDDVKRLLIFYGIQSRKKHTTTTLDGYDRVYNRYDLCISGHNIIRFSDAFSLTHTTKQSKLNNAVESIKKLSHRYRNEYLRIVSVEKTDIIEDVYDITVYDDTHTFLMETGVTGNCAEQGLRHAELCCLVETFPANHDSAEEYYETLKYAFLYAKTVTLLPTHSPLTNQVMLQNRRIGLSMSGVQQAIKKFTFGKFFAEFCDIGYEKVRHWDRIYSRWLGIPTSIKVTTVKPSGSVSLLAGATPGVHCTHAPFYFRTIRMPALDPMVIKLLNAGYKIELELREEDRIKESGLLTALPTNMVITSEQLERSVVVNGLKKFGELGGSVVVYFPVEEKNFTKSKFEISLWEQLCLARELQDKWSDNSVSVTVTFKPEESKDLKSAIEYMAPYVKTLSFLPLEDHNYKQAPYQTCTEKEYRDYANSLKKLRLGTVKGKEGGSKFCSNDGCEI